jgi:hypothetical protein
MATNSKDIKDIKDIKDTVIDIYDGYEYETMLEKKMYRDGHSSHAYSLYGYTSTFLDIWKHKIKIAKLWDIVSSDWLFFFESLQNYIEHIEFIHDENLASNLTSISIPKTYYNVDSIIYLTKDGQKINVDYGNLINQEGSIYDVKLGYQKRLLDDKFSSSKNICCTNFTNCSNYNNRIMEKKDFFKALDITDKKYHLGLFLLTFEDILACSKNTQSNLFMNKNMFSHTCLSTFTCLNDKCVIL